jgi:hypothetical protein
VWALFAFSCFNVESFVSSPSRSLCFDWRCLRYRRRRRVDVEASQSESDSASSRSDRRSRKDRDPKTETRIPRSTLRPKFLEFLLELSSWNKNRDFIKQLAKSQEFFFWLWMLLFESTISTISTPLFCGYELKTIFYGFLGRIP